MLQTARERVPHAGFLQADIADITLPDPPDLLFANASLHWLADHLDVLSKLLAALSPGGWLAVQMPNNFGEPSHRLMEETIALPPFAEARRKLSGTRVPLAGAGEYYDRLRPAADSLRIWETRYLHALDGHEAIVAWFSSTALKPYLDACGEKLAPVFVRDYESALVRAYSRRVDGAVLLAMPRLFILAQRAK